MTAIFTDPTELIFEISSTSHATAWEQSQAHSAPDSCWNAYLNRLCLDVMLDDTQTDWVPAPVIAISALPAIWEVVNGSLIAFEQIRVALIPSEAIDDCELAVPQEWVDIPSWAADYYFAIQVQPESNYIRVWGYTTHQDLKQLGQYDSFDRTYCLDARHLTRDLAAFWVTAQFCPDHPRAAIAPLASINSTQAETLLTRLSRPNTRFPRLAIPFSMWSALLENEQWRQRLYQQRTHLPSIVNLRQWLNNRFETGWQAIESVFGDRAQLAFSARTLADSSVVQRAKLIDLGMQLDTRSLVLLVVLIPEANNAINIQVQLHPSLAEQSLPAQVKLALLDESGESLQTVQARQHDDYVQLSFYAEMGEIFRLQVSLNELQVTESFTV